MIWVEVIFPLSPSVRTIFVSYPVSWILATICHMILVIFAYKKIVNNKNLSLEIKEKI